MGLLNLLGSLAARAKEGQWKKNAVLRRGEAQGNLKKLQYLRISDTAVKAALQPLVTAGQTYLDQASALETWDPQAHQALVQTLDVLGAFLREQDETAVETRFSQPDQNPFLQAQERVVSSLRDLAKTLRDRTEALSPDRPGPDTLTIHEELK